VDEALRAFDLGAPAAEVLPWGEGHIHRTFRVTTRLGRRFLLQRINTAAFRRPQELMENIVRVTRYLAGEIQKAGGDPTRETLRVLYPRDGGLYFTDHDGGAWRVYPFIEGTVCFSSAPSVQVFAASGRAFGRFGYLLRDYPADTLHETIPRFHDTENRLAQLKAAVRADPLGRAAACREEIDFAMEREGDCSVALDALRRGILPLRVTHNDTKLSNVLFDARTGREVCVVDLDTVMPGLAIYDFGDSIRSGANRCAEDERDMSAVRLDLERYAAYTRAFLEGTQGSLTDAEVEYLPWGARLMTLECGMRFLTDYLEGDVYFRTSRPRQNLDRCRTQFQLLRDMERHWERLGEITSRKTSFERRTAL